MRPCLKSSSMSETLRNAGPSDDPFIDSDQERDRQREFDDRLNHSGCWDQRFRQEPVQARNELQEVRPIAPRHTLRSVRAIEVKAALKDVAKDKPWMGVFRRRQAGRKRQFTDGDLPPIEAQGWKILPTSWWGISAIANSRCHSQSRARDARSHEATIDRA
jgi:hypothetical protein